MERRKAIKNIGLTFGAFVATPTALSFLQSCQSETPWTPSFLTEEEGKVVRKMVDVILPASGELPSATEVNVHVFIDKYNNEVMKPYQQENERLGLKATIAALLAASGKEKAGSLSDSDIDSFLSSRLKKSKTEADTIGEQVKKHMKENEKSMAGLSEDVQVYSYLNGLRGRAIWAYKCNERVGEQVLAYRPVPGQQKGCLTVEEATGGKVWSL